MTNQQQYDPTAELIPPHSAEAEQAVIGSITIDPDALFEVMDLIQPEDFYRHQAKMAYAAILSLSAARQPIDLLALTQRLRDQGDEMPEMFLIECQNTVPTAINARQYAGIVADLAARRRLIQAGQKVARLGYQVEGDLVSQLDEAESTVLAARGERARQGILSPRAYITGYLERIESARNGQVSTGIPTGFTDLDKMLKGMERGEQYVLAGRPGMGKSAFAVNAAWYLAKMGKRVAIFSLEMTENQLVDRIVASETGVDTQKLREPATLHDTELAQVYEVSGRISDSRLYIDTTPAQTPAQIRAKCMRLYAEHGLDLVVIDHMHLMQPPRRTGNNQTEIGDISQETRDLAKIVNAPVLTLAQLNRGVEARQNKRPQLSDLRESGRIEENAAVVLFLYRDDYYDEFSEKPNQTEVIVAKNRLGQTGTIELYWSGRTTSFRNLKKQALNL